MKNIVVPTDFSECALNALKTASDIARKHGNATLHIVHVYERPISGITMSFEINNKELRKIRAAIHEKMGQLAKSNFLKGIKLVKHFIPDKEIWEMMKIKSLKSADLIVMGTHGIKGWKELFVGSNTQKMVQCVECPVLVIKEHTGKFKMKDMVFASDFYREAATVFVKIKKLATLFNARVHLLRVNTPGDFQTSHDSRSLMHNFSKKFNLKNYSVNIYNDLSVEDGLAQFTKTFPVDVVAIETHGRTGISHLINSSIAESVVNHLDKPILCIKIKVNNQPEA